MISLHHPLQIAQIAYAARRRLGSSMGARLSLSLNGFSIRLSVSWVGLWRGLIARRMLGLAMPIFAENSFIPMARMTLPKAI